MVGAVIAQLVGKPIPWLIDFTQAGIFLVILSIMVSVEIKDVSRAFRKVKLTAVALFINFVFVPLFAWTLGWLFLRSYPDFWMGAILYALTPCIGWYLIFTDITKGDVGWGVALLPWDLSLQIMLVPVYMYFLIGKIIPVDTGTILTNVLLFFIGPFVLSYLIQKLVKSRRGAGYLLGDFKKWTSDVKLWGLFLVLVAMFASQGPLGLMGAGEVALLIAFLIGFFAVQFLIAIATGTLLNLGYEDTVTLSFTTMTRNSSSDRNRSGCLSWSPLGLSRNNSRTCHRASCAASDKQGVA
jgi:ACR3 family arsenite transporter